MSLLLSLALSVFPTHAATPEQMACIAEVSLPLTRVEERDGVWYHTTSFAAQKVRPVPYTELTIAHITRGRARRMAMYDYNNDGVVDYATYHKETAPNEWAPIRPHRMYMSPLWYMPDNVSAINPKMGPSWQSKFDEGIAVVGKPYGC